MLKDQLNDEFEIKNLGNAKNILAMEICRERKARILHLSQNKYIAKVLKCFCRRTASQLHSVGLSLQS